MQKEIENLCGIRRSTATEILKSMMSNGLIESFSVENDKRQNKLVLTDKAISIKKELDKNMNIMENKLLDNLSKNQIEDFYEIINIMCSNMEDNI